MSGEHGKIKVLMVGGLPPDLQSVRGGVEAVILNLFAGFSSLPDVTVVNVAFEKGIQQQRVVKFSEKARVYFLPFRSRFPLVDYFVNQQPLRKIIKDENPDVIHIQESEPHLLRFLNYPKHNIIVTQHGIMSEELKYAKGVKEKLKFLFKTWVERFVFPRFKNVIFISNYNKHLFTGQLTNFRIIYNPVNPIFFQERPAREHATNSIIYVGVINRRKNIGIILDTLYKLKQAGIIFRLHVVGGYKEQTFEKEVMRWVRQLDLAGQIVFHGWLKQEEILSVYDQCEYFVLPSRQETLPMSVAEAMALGKIVIATDVGAISEMFHDKSTGFLFNRDEVDHLARLLRELSNHSMPEMKNQIRQEALEKFNPVEVARQTAEFYRTVICHKL